MIVWLPALNDDVLNDTVPALPNADCAKIFVPSWKVTIPVGIVELGGFVATVAVNVTDCPGAEGFGEELTDVDEGKAWTFCTSVMLPGLKVPSPLYVVVIKCCAALRDEVENDAWPVASRFKLASVMVLEPVAVYTVS